MAKDFADNYRHQVIDERTDRPGKPYIKLLGDFSGDGNPDILVASANGKGIVWYEYPGWRRQVIRKDGIFSEEGKLADMDDDGDLDAIIPGKQGIHWYENPLDTSVETCDATPVIWREHYIGSDGANIHDLSVADLDKDGRLEVIARYEKELRRPLTIWFHTSADGWEALGANWNDEALAELWIRK